MRYYICQKCFKPIFWHGIMVFEQKKGKYEKEGKSYHKSCWKKVYEKWKKENLKQ